jgi:hypothetical protein
MKEGLSVKFNHKAPPKEIKTESDIKVGVRRKADGSSMYVRAGKVVSISENPETKRRIEEMRQAAVDYCVRQKEDARIAGLRIAEGGIKIHVGSKSGGSKLSL